MLTNSQLIRNYGLDIDEFAEISPFELVNTLAIRDGLEEDYQLLTQQEKLALKMHDKKLIAKAAEFNKELKKAVNLDGSEPLSRWWTHLEKVASGELVIDLDNRKVYLKNGPAATRTA